MADVLSFFNQYYLSILILLPLLFALIIPFLPDQPASDSQDGPESKQAKGIHTFAVLASVLIHLFAMLSWTGSWFGVITPKEELYHWLPSFGISYALGTDGLSQIMVILTTFLLTMSVVASTVYIKTRLKLYYSMLFILTSSLLGVFLARDAFLFLLFYELELIPMYLLIAIWGGPRRDYASMKFVLYTLFGSVFLIAGILAIFFYLDGAKGVETSEIFLFKTLDTHLVGTIPLLAQLWIFSALFIGFSVKLPVVPFHTWLPDAHVEAPTPVSMLLAGILLKMGAYGLVRFCFGFFPEAAVSLAPAVAVLAVINIVYTAGVALVQTDLKKLIAYSSVSHMGFVILGLAALNTTGFNGAVFVMFSHGIVSAALFMCVGSLYHRTHTRMIADYGGFGSVSPTIFYFFMFMSMASLGLPLLISFAGESLVFYGSFTSNAFHTLIQLGKLGSWQWTMQAAAGFSALGIVIGAAYLLWMLQRVFFGPLSERWQGKMTDANRSEVLVLATLALFVIAYGFAPKFLTHQYEDVVDKMATQYQFPDGKYTLSSTKEGRE
ncbi:MAG: NADH-quinone oxidoreductase subunit M [Cyanobacteria bacterium]|nr:NADH-quinone oxidoreductase subunit M [Cyanobacteriota bacterium]